MKKLFCIFFLFLTHLAFAQKQLINYNTIDESVTFIDASSATELVKKLTEPYHTSPEKVRAIFSWIAQNISYNYRSNKSPGPVSKFSVSYHYAEAMDTSTELKPRDQLVAETVLKRRTAVCDGYSRLFKWLCDLSNIPCEVINGYGRTDPGRIGRKFTSNHSWNAVFVDSGWHLLDVTWASGYFMYGIDEFIKHFDDQYFFTPAEQFAEDHFPEDPAWSLLPEPLAIKEFTNSPFKSLSFWKYTFSSYSPTNGIIEATVGDTIQLQIHIDPTQKTREIGGGYFTDSSALLLPSTVFLKPLKDADNMASYRYIVVPADTHWLQLIYNNDLIMRYELKIKNKIPK